MSTLKYFPVQNTRYFISEMVWSLIGNPSVFTQSYCNLLSHVLLISLMGLLFPEGKHRSTSGGGGERLDRESGGRGNLNVDVLY